jgi:exopolysaccharide biosynthesis polyprenyl glycosylphosphotransferase
MQRRTVDRPLFRWAALAGDGLAALAALAIATAVRRSFQIPLTSSRLPFENFTLSSKVLGVTLIVQVLTLSLFGGYAARVRVGGSLGRLLVTVQGVQLLAFSTLLYFSQILPFPRSVLLLYLVVDGVFLYLERYFLRSLSLSGGRRRALVVGNSEQGKLLAEAIRRHPWTGIDLAGIATPDPHGAPGEGIHLVREPSDLERVIEQTGSDYVLFAPEEASFRDDAIEHLALSGKSSLWVLPSAYETLIGRLRFRPLGELPLLEVGTSAPQGLAAAAKRGADIAVSAAGLLLASPVLALAAAAIRLSGGSPVFYCQERVGRDGRPFRLWKLRTMKLNAEESTGAVLASRDDPRVTRIGRFLRASRLDEVTQLFNVLKGEMSLVGPRPERPEFVKTFQSEIPGYELRFAVRPGLTGLAQVSGEYETHPKIKLRYDLAYINNWSLGLDLVIVARTLPVVLTRRGV